MMKRTLRPLIEVRHSPIHGDGVFALRRIRKGTKVIEYLGDRVSHQEADARYEDKDPNDNHTFLFTVDSRTVIDGGVDGNDARFINHGCDPNCASASVKGRIYIEAVRTIRPGEELAYDYQIERDPDDPPNVDEIFACRCGAAGCRGSMLVGAVSTRNRLRKKSRAKPTVQAKKRNRSVTKKSASALSSRAAQRRTDALRSAGRRAAEPRRIIRGRKRYVADASFGRLAKRRGGAR